MSQFDRTIGPSADAGAEPDRETEIKSESETRTESRMLPADVFATLGNDTRVDILRVLLELGADDDPVSFTTSSKRSRFRTARTSATTSANSPTTLSSGATRATSSAIPAGRS